MSRFRIATFNIHKARGLDRRTRISRIASVLRELGAGIVCLQEIYRHQAEELAHQLGYEFVFGPARDHLGFAYGNATLSRFGFAHHRIIDITVPGYEPRAVLRTDLHAAGWHLHVFNLHLGTAWWERRRQAARLIEHDLLRAPDLSGQRIVAGDLNEWIRGQVSYTLRREFHHAEFGQPVPHHPPVPAFPALLPLLSLDAIYFDPALRFSRARPHRSPLSRVASDHLPLVAELG